MGELWERLMIFAINIFCPPISVMLVAGPSTDCLLNTLFFIAGVIPGHIHGFYITCTYFHRKRRVRKGRYPGGKKPFIFSEKVWNGGASRAKVNDLWRKEQLKKEDDMLRSRSRNKRGGNWRV
jgi:uncharacterized membrane protein YqaE (UPF0057 family)